MHIELSLDDEGAVSEVSVVRNPVLCKNCGDSIECIEGVLWVHRWIEYEWHQYLPARISREFCVVDAWVAKHGGEWTDITAQQAYAVGLLDREETTAQPSEERPEPRRWQYPVIMNLPV